MDAHESRAAVHPRSGGDSSPFPHIHDCAGERVVRGDLGPGSPAVYVNSLRSKGELLTQFSGAGHLSNDNYISMTSGQQPSQPTESDCTSWFAYVQVDGSAAYGNGISISDKGEQSRTLHNSMDSRSTKASGVFSLPDDTDVLKRLSSLVERGKTILDVGCGDGIPVDRYLVGEGFALNGIDVSPRMVEQARKNVPEGFFEVKDMFDLREGEYCVDGVVCLHAMVHSPRDNYRGLLETFASFMANGGALLVALRPDEGADDDVQASSAVGSHGEVMSNTELVETVGFTIVSGAIAGPAVGKRQMILARS